MRDGDAPERRHARATAAELPPLPVDPADAIGGLRKGLQAWGAARFFVAAFELDFRRLVRLVIAALPRELQGPRLGDLAESDELPKGEEARLYGLVTALSEEPPPRFRLVPPVRLPDCFRLLLEEASRRAGDEPVRSYWVPLAAVARGSITVVDAESVKLDHPLVVFRIQRGEMRVAETSGISLEARA